VVPPGRAPLASLWRTRDAGIAAVALLAIALHLGLTFGTNATAAIRIVPLIVALVVGGAPLVLTLGRHLLHGRFGTDLLAGISIVSAAALGEYLVGVVVVLMLSGGQALERYATARASAVLDAVARRSPSVAHRLDGEVITDIALPDVAIGDALVVFPHELCPVDGLVLSGESLMDESYLSGEPFLMKKIAGSQVMSGAVNGDGVLRIVAERHAADSRYERIMDIVRAGEAQRPPLQRMGDRLGAWYTPIALAAASLGWVASGDPDRFLAVLVIATPCPLLLAIPIAILGAISLAARRGILIRDAALLERIGSCETVIFDKTGTLTAGRPELTGVVTRNGWTREGVLQLASGLEQYSRHPLAPAILQAADREGIERPSADEVSERPGQGLTGRVLGHTVSICGRKHVPAAQLAELAAEVGGLECIVVVDGEVAGVCRFRDVPKSDSRSFVGHLGPRHRVKRVLLVSGDRESEVRYLGGIVGIDDVHFGKSPEEKVTIVRRETERNPTLFVGDGLNDAPAMLAATVGVALGQQNEVTAEAAGAVVLDGQLSRVDELIHISNRTRRIALQSAVGGMLVSVAGMGLAIVGWLPPLSGAILQEVIDVAAVFNALRAALPPRDLTDF
jgi:heavy metal translocating P-type ATPase